MPKPVVNNKITYQNIYGLISKHDGYLSQGVKAGDSPTFSNLLLTGDGTIRGNLYVEGNTTILNTNVIEFEDNILLLNRLETGSGVTLNQSGLEIERGSLENYRMVFNELDKTFKIGVISNLQAVATREDTPLDNGIMIWDNVNKRLKSTNDFGLDTFFNSTTESTSTSTGAMVLNGGLAVAKNIWSNGKLFLRGESHTNASVIWTDTTTNSLNVSSESDINLSPLGNIIIPYDKRIVLGETDEYISADSTTKDINITGLGSINLNLSAGKRINVPNQIPITFSTQSEKIYTDSSNNMVIECSQDINFIPGPNKKVTVPLNTGLTFSNNNQQISANLNNDLMIVAGNNIMLTPGPTLDVRIPTDNGIKFGNGGLQRIYADSSDDLYIKSAENIYLDANVSVNIQEDIKLRFGDDMRYIKSSSGNLYIKTDNKILMITTSDVVIDSTSDSNNATTGSLSILGGLGVSKRLYNEGGVTINSDSSDSLIVKSGSFVEDILTVDSSGLGSVSIVSGDGSSASVKVKSTSTIDSKSLIVLTTQNDGNEKYKIGRGYQSNNTGRTFTINIPEYSDYASSGSVPKFAITTSDCTTELLSVESQTGNVVSNSTVDALYTTSASFVISGGLGVVKNIITEGDLFSKTESTTAVDIKNNVDSSVFNVDTVNNKIRILGGVTVNNSVGNYLDIGDGKFTLNSETDVLYNVMASVFASTEETTDVSNGALVISGGLSVAKSLRVSGNIYFNNDIDMNGKAIKNVKDPVDLQDVATKAYVDLASLRGLYIKQSVDVATVTAGNLATDFSTGAEVDGYILKLYDRILIKDQLNPVENGIYIVQASGSPNRSMDMIIGEHAAGVFTFVKAGILNVSLGWICNSSIDFDVVGTDDLYFAQFTALGQVDAGDGLTKTFNRLDVNVDDTSIEIDSDVLRIKNTAAGTGMTGGSGTPLQTSTDQSHVTKLGVINTGTWNASQIAVSYGGTGNSRFTKGNILFGDGTNSIKTDTKFYYDNVNGMLGIGTNAPTKTIHVNNSSTASLMLNGDSNGVSSTAKSELIFSYTGDIKSYIGLSRAANEYANNVYPGSLVIGHDKLDSTSVIQLATQRQTRLTVSSNGNVGIGTSNPNSTLYVTGTFTTTGINTFISTIDSTSTSNGSIIVSGGLGVIKKSNFGGRVYVYDNTPSTSIGTGAVVVRGGLSIQGNENAVNVGNGGALTVQGGASIGGDLYVGGSINGSGSSSSTYAYLTLTATDDAINLSTGSLITFGGITIQATTNASSITDGGSILTLGGASIGADVYIGGDLYNYGKTKYYSNATILEFFDENTTIRYSFDRDSVTGDFSFTRYNPSGMFVEKVLSINSTDGSVVFGNTITSLSSTYASIILTGGLSIACSEEAVNISNGGGITLAGGMAIGKGLLIGGDVTIFSTTQTTDVTSASFVVYGGASILKDASIYGNMNVDQRLTLEDSFEYKHGGKLDTITNYTSNPEWYYFGKLNDVSSVSFCEIELTSESVQGISRVKSFISINDTTATTSHDSYGVDVSTDLYLYRDTFDYFHIFVKVQPDSVVRVNVSGKTGGRFNIVYEGDNLNPDGSISGYDISWIKQYDTTGDSNLSCRLGDVRVDGINFKVADNYPVIGYNNSNVTESRNLGVLFERYQSSNDIGDGEIVTDNYVSYDSIPNQSSANSMQIKFSNLLSDIDDYYVGWWIRVNSGSNTDQVRKIVGYNGVQRVATLDIAWSNQNPQSGDVIFLYNTQYASVQYDHTLKRFELVFNSLDTGTKTVTSYEYIGLKANSVELVSTEISDSVSYGSLKTQGGISILNTEDASSSTSGGSLTTLGGVGISKTLRVGDKIGIGNYNFAPEESLHIKQQTATMRLQSDNANASYIDFVETGSGNRYGILSENGTFSLTLTNSSVTPPFANKFLTTDTSGFVGINTTFGITSPLTLPSGNFISCDTNTSYVGLIGGSSNQNDTTNAGRVVVYGNDSLLNSGDVILSSGTSGSLRFYTNDDNERMNIDDSGKVTILTTLTSSSSTSGAFCVNGGISVATTEDASSLTQGGSLTVAGGASIAKSLYIGGNLVIDGNFNASGSVTTPTLNFSNTVNCTLIGYDNSKLIKISQEGILSFGIRVTPSVVSENCEIQFALPDKTTSFVQRNELISTCSGYTDDDSIIPLFNVICVGVKGETRGLIKFQSASTGIHYFTVICRYLIDT